MNYNQQLIKVVQRLCLSTLMFFAIPTALVKAETRFAPVPDSDAVAKQVRRNHFLAQVIPDESLSTSVEQQGENELNINGGEREGNNLFHSFEEFSVSEGIEAVFETAPDVENIFTRVTGNTISDINGILRTQGGANFFLINPNGIVFGENAQLDVGGSFIATTASNIQFEDGVEFTTNVEVEAEHILTVSVPIGLQFEGDSGAISVNATGNPISRQSQFGFTPFVRSEVPGLSVSPDQTLALIGNRINFNGGAILSEGTQVALGSVSFGLVKLETKHGQLDLTYEDVTFNDINFRQNALVDPSGADTSSISVVGKDIALTDTSILLIQNSSNAASGAITIIASDSLTLEEGSNITTETTGQENASPIKIDATNVFLKDQGSILSGAFDAGNSGDLNITVAQEFEIINSASPGFPGGLTSFTVGSGNAGNVTISTQEFRASQGSVVASSTASIGNSGMLNINADLIELNGTTGEQGIFTFVGTTSLGEGVGGSVNINTNDLRILNGAAISSDSSSDANAGSITINASESIKIIGLDPNTTNQSSINSSITILEGSLRERLGLPAVPSGNAGDVTIITPELTVSQEGAISVENQGSGEGGTLFINANQLNLDTAGEITAANASGTGGNINLDTNNLQIDEGGKITATAQNDGDGGNIRIKTNTLIAKKNSQVIANAFQGRGGNLDINAEGLFLFDSPENIFSASSELGIDGTITINTPDINLQKELEPSELEFITANEAIANSCLARKNQKGSFTVNRHDSFPRNPNSSYSDTSYSLTGIDSLTTTTKQPTQIQLKNSPSHQSIVPAEKMVETEDGRIFLVAAPRKAESFFCQGAEQK